MRLAKPMKIVQTPAFAKAVKRLQANQKKDLDVAVRVLMADPFVGTRKAGDLAGVYVHKFKMVKQLTLLAYSYEEQVITLTLLVLGIHENFCRRHQAIIVNNGFNQKYAARPALWLPKAVFDIAPHSS